LVNNVYEDKTVSITQINCIIKAVKEEKSTKMTKMTANVMVDFTAAI
jgi:hypothetical protein